MAGAAPLRDSAGVPAPATLQPDVAVPAGPDLSSPHRQPARTECHTMTAAKPIDALLSLTAHAWGLPVRRLAGRGPSLRQRAFSIRARAVKSAAAAPLRPAERLRSFRSTVI